MLSEKPENELDMESVTEEIKNYIKRIRSMAIEVTMTVWKCCKLVGSK